MQNICFEAKCGINLFVWNSIPFYTHIVFSAQSSRLQCGYMVMGMVRYVVQFLQETGMVFAHRISTIANVRISVTSHIDKASTLPQFHVMSSHIRTLIEPQKSARRNRRGMPLWISLYSMTMSMLPFCSGFLIYSRSPCSWNLGTISWVNAVSTSSCDAMKTKFDAADIQYAYPIFPSRNGSDSVPSSWTSIQFLEMTF